MYRTRMLISLVVWLALLVASSPVAAQGTVPPAQLDPASQTLPLPLTGIVEVAASYGHTCALTTGGGLTCWGLNNHGQLGDGNASIDSLSPVDVVGLVSGVTAVAASGSHTCAVTTGGGVKCWGDNFYGQLGDGHAPTDRDTPVNVAGLGSAVAAVAAGSIHTCVLTTGGGVQCWGDNFYGQLGDGNAPIDTDSPVDVVGLGSGVTAIATGLYHSCALTTGGGIQCWGYNGFGQLGDDNAPTDRDTPVDVVGLGGGDLAVTAITAGARHTCALTTGGEAGCWGDNGDGQLGDDNAPTDRDIPVPVLGLVNGMTAIAASDDSSHTCVLTTTGGVKCWGDNANGQLGDGHTPADHDTPGDVINLTSGVAAVAAGDGHTCAVTTGGGIKCWGDNEYGQLGDGTRLDRGLPGDVLAPTTCYQLTRNKTGSGTVPAVDPTQTPGCPANHYLSGQIITLLADSTANTRVNGWSGAANNTIHTEVNYLIMPARDHSVSVTYATCHALTRRHSGSGGNPIAAPDRSDDCPEHTYVGGETIALIAKPNADQRIASWSGADTNPFMGALVNTLTMPNQARTVNVVYEACFALSAVIAGQGDPLTAAPPLSIGCAASSYVAGQAITLTAAPAPGWSIQSWSGTSNNATTAPTNQLTMPAANAVVGVTYVETTIPVDPPDLFLPSLHR